MNKWFKEILFTEEQIVNKCKELGRWVSDEYKNSKTLTLVGLLKGSVPFMAELIKHISIEHAIDFMTVSSYHGGVKSSGNLKVVMDLSASIENKDILIVEDIVDTGVTLNTLCARLKNQNPKSLKVLTLMDKPEGRKINFVADKVGFKVPNKFLAGFGLDVKEKLRNFPFVGVFDQDKINEL